MIQPRAEVLLLTKRLVEQMRFATAQARLERISGAARIGLVAGGYVAALAVASLALFLYGQLTSGPDRDASSGMYAFADGMVFVLVFAAGSLAPTVLLLYFLRAFVAPWRVFATVGLAVSFTGSLAAVSLAWSLAETGAWPMMAVLRVFLAPVLLGLFVLVGLFSPHCGSKRALFAAAGVECLTSAYGFMHWFVPALFH